MNKTEDSLNRINLLLAAILLNRHNPLAPHHIGWIREHLGDKTDEELDLFILTGNLYSPKEKKSSAIKVNDLVDSHSMIGGEDETCGGGVRDMQKIDVRFWMSDETGDWHEAFGFAGEPNAYNGYAETGPHKTLFAIITDPKCPTTPFTRQDVKKIFNMRYGENDGANWLIWGQLKDKRYFYIKAGCDYTGWDCQAGGSVWLGRELEEFKRFGLDDEARKEWDISIDGKGRGDYE